MGDGATLKDKIITLLTHRDGLTDREIADEILGRHEPQQSVNQACRSLMGKGGLKRTKRKDGLVGNFVNFESESVQLFVSHPEEVVAEPPASVFAEDTLKQILKNYLHKEGWETQIAWGRTPGIDINAIRGSERRIIEVKGLGSSNPMNVNYFLGVLAETLQRMEDPNAKYSIALPDVKQFRNLWSRLPLLAKKRTGITAIFINELGEIEESSC